MPALDDLRVAGDDLDAGGPRRRRHRLDLGAELGGGETLLEHQRDGQRQRPGAGDGEVVDGSVHRQLPDRAAREADRPDDEAVGRQRQSGAVDLDRTGVAELGQRRRSEGGLEQSFDQRLRRLAAGAVGHRHQLVAEARALAAGGLDDALDPLLAPGVGAGPCGRLLAHPASSRCREWRP